MSDSPTVTVVIPTYNRAHLVGRAVASVLAQTFADWECLVVDDGSTDNTAALVRSFADPRVRYMRHEANQGASAARNTGVRAARGKYVAFLDSDDEWLPEKLELQTALFESSPLRPGVTYTAAYQVDTPSRRRALVRPQLVGNVFQTLLLQQHIAFSSVMVRTNLVIAVGGLDESMPRGMDRDLLLRLAGVTNFDGLPEPVVRQHLNHGPQLHGDTAKSVVYKQRLLEKLKLMPQVPKSVLSYHHRSLGMLLLKQKAYRQAMLQMLLSLRFSPTDPKPYLNIIRIGCRWAVSASVTGMK